MPKPIPLVWINSPRVDMSLHSDTLSWFRVDQSLLLLLNDACKCKLYYLCFTPSWLESTIFHIQGQHATYYNTGHTSVFHMQVKCQPSHLTYLMSWWSFRCQFRPRCHPFLTNTISCRNEIKYSIRVVALCTLNVLLHMIL